MKFEIKLDMDDDDLMELIRCHGEQGAVLRVMKIREKVGIKEITLKLKTGVC